ncbi:hypothetical protein N9N67_10415 [Bacteriovoracaceae bacterium]|nr:hypothetical protein [Bacteriovoracaceae bacterium]
MRHSILLALFTLFALSTNAFSNEIIGYKYGGSKIKKANDVEQLIKEFDRLRADEEYEILDSDLCVIYSSNENAKYDSKLDKILKKNGYTMELEGIYGSFGDHMFEIYDYRTNKYLGAFSGVYACE